MGTYVINPENVARIAVQTMHDLSGNFDKLECVMGLIEAASRIIVDSCDSPFQAQELAKVANERMLSVMRAGFHAKGFTV